MSKNHLRKKSFTSSFLFASRVSSFLSIDRVMIGGSILASVLILVVIYAMRDKPPPKLDPNIPDKSVAADIQGVQHIEENEPHTPYNTNPPTSGPHSANPLSWGIYDSVVSDERAVHNLEHGGIWISYRDQADQATIDALKDITEHYESHILLSHRPQNDNSIAVVAWGRLLTLEEVDSEQIFNFIARYQFQGPENVR